MKKTFFLSAVLLTATLASAGCTDKSAEQCTTGTLNCLCGAYNACDVGLACFQGICVTSTSEPVAGSGSNSNPDVSSTISDASTSVGDTSNSIWDTSTSTGDVGTNSGNDAGGSCLYQCTNQCVLNGGTLMPGNCSNFLLQCCDLGPMVFDASLDGGQQADTGSDTGLNADAGSRIDTGVDTSPYPGADVEINLNVEHQHISGFGGINVPGWIADLTLDQADTAFGNGPGQIGMSILRLRIPYNSSDFQSEVPTVQRAVSHGATVFATPWTPPPQMKTNNNIVAGRLKTDSYGAYADHLLGFRDYMESNSVPIYAISIQNEPDYRVEYESCDWSPQEMISWLVGQASKFGNTKLMAAESYNFNRAATDPILNDPSAEPLFDIVAGHIYGNGLYDYPLARQKGKEIWMTEHYTDSDNDANLWPNALNVAKEINDCMQANFSAYIWWYIRRFYGPIAENGQVSKRGYMMAQYSKYVRPGFIRVDASVGGRPNIHVTAYKDGSKVVVVAVNMGSNSQNLTLHIQNGIVGSFTQITSSGGKNLSEDGTIAVTDHLASISLDGQSISTFIGD